MAERPGPWSENIQRQNRWARECPGRQADASPRAHRLASRDCAPEPRERGPFPEAHTVPAGHPRQCPEWKGMLLVYPVPAVPFPDCSGSPRRSRSALPFLHKGRACSTVTQMRKPGPREVPWAAQVHTARQWPNLEPRTSDFKAIALLTTSRTGRRTC